MMKKDLLPEEWQEMAGKRLWMPAPDSRLTYRTVIVLAVLVPLLYAFPYLVFAHSPAGEITRLISFGVPFMTSLLISLFLGWPGLIVASAAHVIGLFLLSGYIEWIDDAIAITLAGVVIALQVAATIITLLVHHMKGHIHEIREANEKLRSISMIDEMTGAYNYRYCMQRLDQELAQAKRHDRHLGVLLLDVDHFKNYNDINGHLAGDAALKRLTELFNDNVRTFDTVTRYGGEEFVIIAPDTDLESLEILAGRLCEVVSEEPFGGAQEQPGGTLTISVGCSSYPTWADSVDQLLRQADHALYHAKQQGGDRAETYGEVPTTALSRNREDIAVLAAVNTLMRIISGRDGYTYGHSRRVMKYCRDIGEELGFDDERMRTLQWAALVHDLGKIELSRSLLTKPGDLDDYEWVHIQRHPEISAQIIEPIIDRMGEIARAVRAHHERYDGTGYPKGVSGEEIPLVARILAVADAIDAMGSERPYRGGLDVEQIVEELAEGKGRQFDPEIADIAIRILAEYDDPVHG